MKITTVLGTRPEIIRLSRVIEKLDRLCNHVLVHTGQNFDTRLSKIFFDELGIRQPNYFLDIQSKTFGEQIGKIITSIEKVLLTEKPDKLLILGDTNSGLAAIVGKRLGIPVYHMEAGNRCFDDRVPEEINRRIIDHSSDILMPYTERSRSNLLREGIDSQRIIVTGNPIREILLHYKKEIEESLIHKILGVQPQQYFLITIHRAENVDHRQRLSNLMQGISNIVRNHQIPAIVSLHPRTKNKLQEFNLAIDHAEIKLCSPFGFFDFVALESKARCVLSDSGTVQEECCILGIPNITLRDTTERPETLECGSNILTGTEPSILTRCTAAVLGQQPSWEVPPEYQRSNVSDGVIKLLLGNP